MKYSASTSTKRKNPPEAYAWFWASAIGCKYYQTMLPEAWSKNTMGGEWVLFDDDEERFYDNRIMGEITEIKSGFVAQSFCAGIIVILPSFKHAVFWLSKVTVYTRSLQPDLRPVDYLNKVGLTFKK